MALLPISVRSVQSVTLRIYVTVYIGRINNAGETDLRLGLQWEFEMDP